MGYIRLSKSINSNLCQSSHNIVCIKMALDNTCDTYIYIHIYTLPGHLLQSQNAVSCYVPCIWLGNYLQHEAYSHLLNSRANVFAECNCICVFSKSIPLSSIEHLGVSKIGHRLTFIVFPLQYSAPLKTMDFYAQGIPMWCTQLWIGP